eukprot:TRINITY_DN11641_c0_g1_i1.p1 TRINITY_DN11641_c0_g1~~TRINITY_DN11641_c0_g1_i1.p1  ORF type:complete len:1320 (+),score=227.77 TRINITY_DN11641_c0_g1_i1:59-4018(+)
MSSPTRPGWGYDTPQKTYDDDVGRKGSMTRATTEYSTPDPARGHQVCLPYGEPTPSNSPKHLTKNAENDFLMSNPVDELWGQSMQTKGSFSRDTAVSIKSVEPPNLERDKTRTIKLGHRHKEYPNNFLRSSRYTLYDFIPRNLYSQFQQISNIYFGLNAVIALIPDVSPITPVTAILPVVFILVVGAIKDAYEDYKRHVDDRENNSAPVSLLGKDGKWKEAASADVMVGDIIKVEHGKQHQLRADVVLIACDDDEGQVYIETSQLDGETSAKERKTVPELQSLIRSTDITNLLSDAQGPAGKKIKVKLNVDPPSKELEKFQGTGTIRNPDGGETHFNIDLSSTIWRSSGIKKAKWVYGVVAYTGHESKIGMNMQQKVPQQSVLTKILNRLVLILFLIKNLFIIPLCFGALSWDRDNDTEAWYLADTLDYHPALMYLMNYLSWFVLLSFMIPISLFVTLQICYHFQSRLMRFDRHMTHWMLGVEKDGGPGWASCRPKTSDLNTDLAFVKYIFSDKTGTLTDNRMEYMTGAIQLHANTPDEKWVEDPIHLLPASFEQSTHPASLLTSEESKAGEVMRYICCLVLCNTVTPTAGKDGEFEGPSPDEVGLVEYAYKIGVKLVKKTTKGVTISIGGREHTYEVLTRLPFSSSRKMMSVIVKSESGEIILISKGADEHEGIGGGMLNRLSGRCASYDSDIVTAIVESKKGTSSSAQPGDSSAIHELDVLWNSDHHGYASPNADTSDNANRIFDSAHKKLTKYAHKGWRTLVFGWKVLSPSWFNEWKEGYRQLVQSTMKIRGPNRTHRKAEVEDMGMLAIEKDLHFGGVLAYEDKLQDKVPETIKFFVDAGVVVWMLTGDKMETAIEIAKTCNLIDPSHLVQLKFDTIEPTERLASARKQLKQLEKQLADLPEGTLSIAVAEPVLAVLLQEEPERFQECAQKLKSAVCARLSPKMKGTIVEACQDYLVSKGRTNDVVLAIGDGGNDVTMINAANVGIGVIGVEGRSAELASDYAIPRFKHLLRLLAVHGRYSKYRSAMCIGWSFYKNIVLALGQVYFAVVSGFSAQTIYDSWLLAIKNTLFTGAPPFILGCLDKDLHEEPLIDPVTGPRLYKMLREEGLYMNSKSMLLWLGSAVLHSLCVWMWYPQMENDNINENGRTSDIYTHGTVLMSGIVCIVLYKFLLHARHHTSVSLLGAFLGSYVFYFSVLAVYSAMTELCVLGECDYIYHGIMDELWGAPAFYFYLLLVGVGLPTTIDLAGLYSQRTWYPTYRDCIQVDPDYPKHPERQFCCCGEFQLEDSDRMVPDDSTDVENSVVESPIPTIKRKRP